MKNTLAHASIVAVGVVLWSGAAGGHHGDAGRYEDTLTTVSGTVVELQLVNPHSIIVVEIEGRERQDRHLARRARRSPRVAGLVLEQGCRQSRREDHHRRPAAEERPALHDPVREGAGDRQAAGKEIFRGNEPGQRDEPGPCAGDGAMRRRTASGFAARSLLLAAGISTRAQNPPTWKQSTHLKASNAGEGDQFGFAIALSGDGNTLAAGAPLEASSATGINGKGDDDSAYSSGAVYVFARSGASWVQQAYLKASNTGLERSVRECGRPQRGRQHARGVRCVRG